jgi:ribosome maturation factor RimP
MNTLEEKVFNLAVPVAQDLGYFIVDVKTFGKESHSFLAGITSVKSFI